ncbi:leukocyte antigen CD37 isoform X2 [Astyanax mexicanus]|uniref:leukocyte antigen CD37 isoform X2 n=1 Tax=Astyanax mexicanus TaxID=7994 RepID=UPI0020CAE6C6|nr:leukocyte antigen CD37 isoform X2 [Astyanax mexicanus]
MASEFCLSLTKYFLFVFNLVFFLLGSALLSLGLWIMFSETGIPIPGLDFIPLSLLSYLLIISGAVTILLGFFGCLGALKEVKCMLAIYFILLTVLLAAQTVGGVLLITQKSTFQNSLDDHMTNIIKEFGKNDSSLEDIKHTLEILQHEAQCCGWTGSEDWNPVPCSCFYLVNVTANATNHNFLSKTCPCDSSSNLTCRKHEQACKGVVDQWLNTHILTILIVVFALALVERFQCGVLARYVVRSFRCVCIDRLLWIIP